MLKFRFDRRIREVLPPTFICCDASAFCQGLLLWSPSGIYALTRGNSAAIWLLIVHLIKHRIGKIAVVLAGERRQLSGARGSGLVVPSMTPKLKR